MVLFLYTHSSTAVVVKSMTSASSVDDQCRGVQPSMLIDAIADDHASAEASGRHQCQKQPSASFLESTSASSSGSSAKPSPPPPRRASPEPQASQSSDLLVAADSLRGRTEARLVSI